MDINLLQSALFIVISMALVFFTHQHHRWKILLATSTLFYFLLVGYKLITILILTGLVYYFSKVRPSNKKIYYVSLASMLVPLLVYKLTLGVDHFSNYHYKDWNILEQNNWTTWFHLLGISYITFNAISYLVDIRRKYIKPEPSFWKLFLYLIYFPAVFSGPLHRAKYLLPQFNTIAITPDSISNGLRLILWGVFKNVVIAQRAYQLLKELQNSEISGIYYLLNGTLFFIYLYANFSAFIDFFQGVSQLFNIRLKDNFGNRIYLAHSRHNFWRGWHITLNEWFRDYFFFVISKKDRKRKYTNIFLLVTFILIALWHEFSIVLLLWGIANGLWIIIEKSISFEKWPLPNVRRFTGVFYHLFFSSVLALLFITPSIGELFDRVICSESLFPTTFVHKFLVSILTLLLCLIIMDIHYSLAGKRRFDDYLGAQKWYFRYGSYAKFIILILTIGMSAGVENYYIQF